LYKYLTLGYGSTWSLSAQQRSPSPAKAQSTEAEEQKTLNTGSLKQEDTALKADPKGSKKEKGVIQELAKSNGCFLIGLVGDLEREESIDGIQEDSGSTTSRTLHVQMDTRRSGDQSLAEESQQLRVVVYLVSDDRAVGLCRLRPEQCQPFIFTFLFEPSSPNLAIPSFYRSLHYQLGPLQVPLLSSTDPQRAAQRMKNAKLEGSLAITKPIYDLIYDPELHTVHSNVPNIPSHEPLENSISTQSSPWTRLEALNVHVQILNTFQATRRRVMEIERTSKTSRGWWVVWTRLPSSGMATQDTSRTRHREAFLIRKASETAPKASRFSTSSLRGIQSSSKDSTWSPSKLAEGIGVDTGKYIEGLLNLNR
jgi:hypothetical protein